MVVYYIDDIFFIEPSQQEVATTVEIPEMGNKT